MKKIKTAIADALYNESKDCGKGPGFLSKEAVKEAFRLHSGYPDYEPTPLVDLKYMAEKLGVKKLFIKDESKRFGLNAFKGIGGLYALFRIVCRELGLDINEADFQTLKKPEYQQKVREMVFVTATDGNHGKGIAWAAGILGCEAHIYMPAGSSKLRAQAIRDVNPKAYVSIMDTQYDDTVRYAFRMAKENGWYLVQDTSCEGYTEIPTWIVQGYTTMAKEAVDQMNALFVRPTHVFVQAGVGAMSGGVVGYLANQYENNRPVFVVAEPENIACIWQSAFVNDKAPHAADIQLPTIMAGLNCGEPCTITWPVLRDFADWYIKCPDDVTKYGMKLLAEPKGTDEAVVSGESGAVTIGLVSLIAGKSENIKLKEAMGIDENSVILCFNTEGDTDPDSYRKIIDGEYPY